MKTRHAYTMTAALALAFSAPLFAQTLVTRTVMPGESIVVETRINPSSAIHSGGMTYDDLVVAERVAAALEDDRALARPGITATVVANNGHVNVTGTADNNVQAQRAMRDAKRAAAPYNVAGFIATSSGG
jgi:hypothetical protein